MAEQLKNTLAFTNLAPGVSVTLEHHLQNATGRPLAADIIFVPSPDLAVTDSDEFTVVLTNQGAEPLTGSILVEAWHTVERAFGGAQNVNLPVKPYVVVSVEGNNQPPQPPFPASPVNITIYARTTGDDTTGDGTLANPYLTLQRAVRDVPSLLPASTFYSVDISGDSSALFTEVLPQDYTLPTWKAPWTEDSPVVTDPIGTQRCAVTIRATPRLMSSLSTADATVNPSDILTVVADPITGLFTITLNASRPSWAGNALRGKFAVDNGPNSTPPTVSAGTNNCAIYESADNGVNASLKVCNSAFFATTVAFLIMEPSAVITGTTSVNTIGSGSARGVLCARNCDSIAFIGLDVSNLSTPLTKPGLAIGGMGSAVMEMCVLWSPILDIVETPALARWNSCVVKGAPIIGGYSTVQRTLMDTITGGAATNKWLSSAVFAAFRNTVFDACSTIEAFARFAGSSAPDQNPGEAACTIQIQHCLVRNVPGATGDGIRLYGAKADLDNVDISGCGRDGIRAGSNSAGVIQGGGSVLLLKVGSTVANGVTTASGVGLNVQSGMSVNLDSTSTALANVISGAGGQLKCGNRAVRTVADFIAATPTTGSPSKNEYDVITTGIGDSFAFGGTTVTMTDAAGLFNSSMVGRIITIAGATTAANNGSFVVLSFISATQITYTNAAGVAEAFTGLWAVAPGNATGSRIFQ